MIATSLNTKPPCYGPDHDKLIIPTDIASKLDLKEGTIPQTAIKEDLKPISIAEC